jgi:hypothetical protein
MTIDPAILAACTDMRSRSVATILFHGSFPCFAAINAAAAAVQALPLVEGLPQSPIPNEQLRLDVIAGCARIMRVPFLDSFDRLLASASAQFWAGATDEELTTLNNALHLQEKTMQQTLTPAHEKTLKSLGITVPADKSAIDWGALLIDIVNAVEAVLALLAGTTPPVPPPAMRGVKNGCEEACCECLAAAKCAIEAAHHSMKCACCCKG